MRPRETALMIGLLLAGCGAPETRDDIHRKLVRREPAAVNRQVRVTAISDWLASQNDAEYRHVEAELVRYGAAAHDTLLLIAKWRPGIQGRRAARIYSRTGDIRALFRILPDMAADVRLETANILRDYGAANLFPELRDWYRAESVVEIRRGILLAMINTGDRRAVPILERAVKSPYRRVADAAVKGLEVFGH